MAFRDEPFHIDGDLAYILCEQYNGYASGTEELELLDEEWVLEMLTSRFDPADLAALVSDDFGRGIVAGQLALLFIMQNADAADSEADNE